MICQIKIGTPGKHSKLGKLGWSTKMDKLGTPGKHGKLSKLGKLN